MKVGYTSFINTRVKSTLDDLLILAFLSLDCFFCNRKVPFNTPAKDKKITNIQIKRKKVQYKNASLKNKAKANYIHAYEKVKIKSIKIIEKKKATNKKINLKVNLWVKRRGTYR